jgi:DegV family protein with EDD domain
VLRIVIDSAGDLPPGWGDKYDIQVIPINIHFGEQTFLQGVDLSNTDFYRLVEESGVIPKTSQPTPQQFVDFYRRVAEPGDTIVSLHVTSKLSGTLDSAEMAARQLEGEFRIFPVDSRSGSAAMGYMAREARLMERAGASAEEIVERWEAIARTVTILLTLDTLEYARMSGRVKALQAALASLLNVKPIVILREGVLELGDRVRTRSKSLNFILEETHKRVGDQLVYAAVVHAEDPGSAKILEEKVSATLNCKELITTELSTGVAANLGPGTVGIITYPVEAGGK